MVSIARGTSSSRRVPARSMRAQPRMALSGVRSSCERTARNSSFSRLASSASASASRSRSSSCVAAVVTSLRSYGILLTETLGCLLFEFLILGLPVGVERRGDDLAQLVFRLRAAIHLEERFGEEEQRRGAVR